MMNVVQRAVLSVAFTLAAATAWAGDPMAGKEVWLQHACPTCHGAQGQPVFPGVPNFSRGERLDKPDDVLVATVEGGTNVMPSWRGIISRKDMFDAVAYIRTLQR